MRRRKVVQRLIEGHEVPFLSLSDLCEELRALLAAEDRWGEEGERRAAAYGNALFFCLLLAEASERMDNALAEFWNNALDLTENQN